MWGLILLPTVNTPERECIYQIKGNDNVGTRLPCPLMKPHCSPENTYVLYNSRKKRDISAVCYSLKRSFFMLNTYRISGRKLQGEKSLICNLIFVLYFLFLFCIGLVPMFVSYFAEKYFYGTNYFAYADLAFAAVSFFTVFFSFSLLKLGRKRFFFKNAFGYETPSSEIFHYFKVKNIVSACLYCIRISAVKTAVYLVCFIPSVLSFVFLFKSIFQGMSVLLSFAVGITALLFLLSGICFALLFSASFFLCDYYFIKGEYLSFRHLVSLSQFVMNGRKGQLVRLKVSFVGWFLLCVTVLPLGFVSGYYNQSLAVAAKEFMQ